MPTDYILLPPATDLPNLLNGLVSWWDLDETGTSSRVDAHGSSDHQTGGSTFGTITGMYGNAIDFNSSPFGSWSATESADYALNGTTGTTIAFWAKWTGFTQWRGPIGLDDGGTNRFWVIQFSSTSGSNGLLDVFVWDTSNSSSSLDSTLTITPNVWHFVVGWYDPADSKFHLSVDGTESATPTFTPKSSGSAYRRIGQCANGAGLDSCAMDLLGFWGKALTSGERTALYNGGAGLAYADL